MDIEEVRHEKRCIMEEASETHVGIQSQSKCIMIKVAEID